MEKNYSFKRGFNQVPIGKADTVKKEIMESLEIISKAAWERRLNGNVDPRVSEITAIEAVFAKHGIKQVWGE
jgi:hypothetical protein